MNENEQIKSIIELKKQQEENENQIEMMREKKRILRMNSSEFKLINIFSFSTITYLLLAASSILITNILSIPTNIFTYNFSLALFGGSIAIGKISQIFLDRKYQTKKLLQSFSSTTTPFEQLEEQEKCQLEIRKKENRNQIINQSINLLSQKDLEFSNDYSQKIDLKKEELEKRIKEGTDKLDLLVTKKFIADYFWDVRLPKELKILNTILLSLATGTFIMFFSCIPTIMISHPGSLLIPFSTFTLGTICSATYLKRRNNNHLKLFNQMNNLLEENKLPKTIETEFDNELEQDKLKRLIEKQMEEISNLKVNQQKNKRNLEQYVQKQKTSFQSIKPIERDNYLNEEKKKNSSLVRKRKIT